MKKIQTCESQEEILQYFINALDNDKYRMMRLKFISIEKRDYSKMDEFVNLNDDGCYEYWNKVRKLLPKIINVNLLFEFKDELELFNKWVKYKIENRKVFYNDSFYRDFNNYYQEKYEISLYDKIKTDLESTILFLSHISKHLEKRISELGLNILPAQTKSLSLKFMKSKTDTAAIFLMLESSGLFFQQGIKKEINKILEDAEFYENGKFVKPNIKSLESIISRNRKGQDNESVKALNGRIKKDMIQAANNFIKNLESGEYSIYEKH